MKVPPPRPLQNNETTHTLAQWKINFRQYCKRDDTYRLFLKSSTTWNSQEVNYGFTNPINGREPSTIADDLLDFLHMLASFLPHGYITGKIVGESTSFESAFLLIEENFGLLPTQESFCDFSSIVREPSEPYRQFFDRLVSYVSKHLMPPSAEPTRVDSIQVPTEGDKMLC